MPLLAEFDDHGSYGSEDVNPISALTWKAQEKLISQHYQQNHGYQFIILKLKISLKEEKDRKRAQF